MAVREIAAAPTSERNTSRTTATSTAPSRSEVTMFRSARSMNSDGPEDVRMERQALDSHGRARAAPAPPPPAAPRPWCWRRAARRSRPRVRAARRPRPRRTCGAGASTTRPEVGEAKDRPVVLADDGLAPAPPASAAWPSARTVIRWLRAVDHPGAADAGRLAGGVDHLRHADAVQTQPIGVELDLQLADLAAEDRDLGRRPVSRAAAAAASSRRRCAGP